MAEARVRHAAVDLLRRHGDPGERHPADPLVCRASGPPGGARARRDVEDSWFLGPLFLFNNLHSLHHESPAIPWYSLPRRYRLERERLLADNGGLVYRTYFEVAWRYLFRAHDEIEHPTDRVPASAA